MYNWQRVLNRKPHSRKGARRRPPSIGISDQGVVTLNRAAYDEIGRPFYVKLFIDEATQHIRIEGAAERDRNFCINRETLRFSSSDLVPLWGRYTALGEIGLAIVCRRATIHKTAPGQEPPADYSTSSDMDC